MVVGYLLVVVALGVAFSRRQSSGDEYFLAGRSMPMWAVSISVLATAQSAATFVGGPQQSYVGDLTYFSANLGSLIAAVVVAVVFVPAFYRRGVTSIYELLGHELGVPAQRSASAMFMVGRVFASGARLFVVSIPFALVAFDSAAPRHLVLSIVIITVIATGYTLAGGIRAVIWTDVLQAVLYVATVSVALWWLWSKVPLGPGELIRTLRETGDGGKLSLVDAGFDSTFSRPYNLWAVLLGLSLLNLAAYGTDQDLTQRMLTCRSARRGSWSVIVANLIGWPIVCLFLVLGLLLYVYYQRPDVMGAAAPQYAIADSRGTFIEFILREMPAGLRGLMMAGLLAAAMSSLDSALNAMASTTVSDFYRPITGRRDGELAASRIAVVGWAVALAAFACFCVAWHHRGTETLIDFSLGVMVFAYSGLLAVFLTALLTRRGNSASAIAALAVGFAASLLMQPSIWAAWTPDSWSRVTPAFGWRMLTATAVSLGVCCMGRRSHKPYAISHKEESSVPRA